MGGRTKKEKAKKFRVKPRGILNIGFSSLNREASTFLIYLPLKSCLFCHHLVKLLYLGKKKIPIVIQVCQVWDCLNILPRFYPTMPLLVQRLHSSQDPSLSPWRSAVSGAPPQHFWAPQVAVRIPSGHPPRRAARSWPGFPWCLSLRGSAAHLGRASRSGDPCKDPESKGSNAFPPWSAEQAWKQSTEGTGKSRTKNLLHKSFNASSNHHYDLCEELK